MNLLNQQARKDLNRRSLISDSVLRLIGRSGVDLLTFKEGLDVHTVNLPADSTRIGELVSDGYEFAGFAPLGAEYGLRMERLEGLFYPVTSVGRG